MVIFTGAGRRRGGVPYPFPAAAPYNVPVWIQTPTPDGTGAAIHPSVIDMGTAWNGYRYWMANTPYWAENYGIENPIILGSNDGFHWEVPPGVTNPVYGPIGSSYCSDTDIAHDPATDSLVLTYRIVYNINSRERIMQAVSADGSTWPEASTETIAPTDTPNALSPSLVRVSASEWRMYACYGSTAGTGVAYWTSTTPTGPWAFAQTCTGVGTTTWHITVRYEGGVYYALGRDLVTMTSADGVAWTRWSGVPLDSPTWEGSFYRHTFTFRDEQTVDLWYTSLTAAHWWRSGYTRVPRSLWPTPPQ